MANAIIHKKYLDYGTDALTLDVDGNKYIYLIDHSPKDVYFENISEGGYGFGVRHRFNVSKLTRNELRIIIRNIAADYGYSAESVRKVLQGLWIRPENMSSVDVDVELEGVINSNVKVYGEDRRAWHKEGYRGKQYYNDSKSSRADEASGNEEGRRDDRIELMRVYHGSRSIFDKFNNEFALQGYGANEYGYGTYVSRSEEVLHNRVSKPYQTF